MKKALITVFILIFGVFGGILLEKYKLTEIIYHDAYVIPAEPEITHYCLCVEENPKSYNTLLVGTEKINDEIDTATREFLSKHDLKGFDMRAVMRVTQNGNQRISIFCSNRTPKVTSLCDDYVKLVDGYFRQYDELLQAVHKE